MVVRTIRNSESLDSVWEELVFTESRLIGDDHSKEFAPTIAQLLAQLEEVRHGQFGSWRDEITAQAAVQAADDHLDDWVRALELTLTSLLGGNTKSPRFWRYFSTAPWTIIRMGLESELIRVRGWADSLASEPEQSLKDLGARLVTLIADGDAALERRRKASGARNDHRVRSITKLIDDVNAARLSIYGDLAKKAAEAHLAPDWPSRFFRRAAKGSKAEPVPPAKPGTPTPAG